MKRLLLGMVPALLLAFTGVPVQAANLQDFTISNYDIRYELARDDTQRSSLRTTETITAQFLRIDQNHGIERSIPKSYDGHSTSLKIESIKKADGSDWDYSDRTDNDNLILRIGDPDEYAKGEQVFVITYSQRDVTRTFNDTKSDEFYWDTNGTEWKVPIQRLNITLAIDGVAANLNGNSACYQGIASSDQACSLTSIEAKTIKTSATNLAQGQNITVAIGFKPGTFAKYEQSVFEKVLGYYIVATVIIGAIGLGVIVWLLVRWYRWSDRKRERGTIVAEYSPPKDSSLTTAASFLGAQSSVFTAQLLDFAVRGYVKIYQTREKSLFKSAEYDIEIVKDITELKAEEREILTDIFNNKTTVGDKLSLKSLKNNTQLYTRTRDNDKKLIDLVRGKYNLRHKDEAKSKWFKNAGWVLLVLSGVLLNPIMLVAAVTAFTCGYTLWPLTNKGLALTRYLEGLKEYIKVAETDRIKMLQSPEGVQKVGAVDPSDGAQLITLYEKVLPYAVLFGQEKEWTKRLGRCYESIGKNPDWYSSNNTIFNAAVFSSAMNGFSTAASYSAASSSSSGGSSGGGSSGGGGGGGGGGGW